jgi:hypothetical protein
LLLLKGASYISIRIIGYNNSISSSTSTPAASSVPVAAMKRNNLKQDIER